MGDIVSLPPNRLEIQPDNIPDELKEKPKWFLWRYEPRVDSEGRTKLTKPPYQVDGKKGKPNDPSTCNTYEAVLKTLVESNGKYIGIGFLLTPDDDLIGWDLDHCIDQNRGVIEPWAERIVNTLQSYTEISPSGEGLRIFVKGKLPDQSKKKVGNVECYQNLRFVTVTGNLYPGFPTSINENNLELWKSYFDKDTKIQKNKEEKEKRKKKITQLDFLEEGNWKDAGFPSQSEADLSYCRYLAEEFNGDKEKIDKQFRESKLFRPKWDKPHYGDGRTYGEGTIDLSLKSWESQFRLTDLGNAKRFAITIKNEVKFCNGRWYIWDGKRLEEDRLQRIYLLTQRVIEQLREESRNAVDEETRKTLWKHMIQLESRGKLEAMIKLTEMQPDIAMYAEELDKDPFLFNTENGILDSTGAIRTHAFEEYITKLSPVNINPKAKAVVFKKFLSEIQPIPENLAFLQRAIGYSMTGSVKEQVLFFAYGTGANGKSTLFHIIAKVFGDYASQLPVESLMASKGDQHPTILADLRGVRFVLASEPEDGRRFNEGLLKQITGGEQIVARRMREDFVRFDSTAKLWIMGNHKPAIRGTDHAIWRRIRLVPFNVVIPKDKQDKELWDKLEGELEGILMWCIEGLHEYLKQGLNPPAGVLEATEEYRQEMDLIQEFLNDEVESDLEHWLLHSDIYARYAKRTNEQNERLISSKAFAAKLREKGYKDARRTANQLYWQGLKLKMNMREEIQKEM